ncbi:putative TIM-barrel fold metal-dependent hydrolase [Azospirillum agricola]|uniref:amidohydrolase family protein n=1 Tax=Azospirillum agricola TaxID=1720247 RepID=UPI001AE59AF7|nr:amidohydrolase family protein [Azospirillum agricola]MBP2231940.1 putative TIM-barrel fold metal-dependent hydrolase [Azospirillum agricola]
MSRKIIDLRSRPAFLHDFYGATPGTPAYEGAKWLNRRVGSKDDEHFTRSHTLDGFIAEIHDAGITAAAVIGRDTPGVSTSNDQVAALIAGRPELIGVGSVDPQRQGVAGALAEVERAVGRLGLKGINLEPGFLAPALAFDDPLLLPVYDACDQFGVPVFLMSGPTTPDPAFNDPAPVGRIARDFPNLTIVCHHGFWPHVAEIVGIAFRHPNVHLVPDMYLFLPGSRLYVEAANGFLRDQLLFGTSFPFRAMKQTVEDFLALGFDEAVLDGLLSGNAERVLKLDL